MKNDLGKQLSSCRSLRQGGLGGCPKLESCEFKSHPGPNSVVSQIWKKYVKKIACASVILRACDGDYPTDP